MSFNVTFQTAADRNAFATKTGLPAEDSATIVVNDNLFVYAMRYEGAQVTYADDAPIKLLVPTAKLGAIGAEYTTVETKGSHTIIETLDPTAVYAACGGDVDCVDVQIKLLSPLSGTNVTTPNDWARRRLSNRFRPFQEFKTFEIRTTNKPVVFLVDSGINSHSDLTGVEIVNFGKLPAFANYSDELGHGTAIASCVAGSKVGITKNVSLYNYKIFSNTIKPTIVELGDVLDNIKQFKLNNPTKNVTVNCSWVIPYSPYIRNKFIGLINAGCVIVCAAGNSADDVSNYTPAGMPEVITVGAIEYDDIVAGFTAAAASDANISSPYGQSLDMFAPGVDVDVANINGNFIRVSGTSVSAGYVSAAASLIQSISQQPPSNAEVLNLLIATSLKGSVLFNRDSFSSNQNRIVQLINGDGFPETELYMGTFSGSIESLTLSLESFAFSYTTNIVGNNIEYEVVWFDNEQKQKYNHLVTFDSSTGYFSINRPDTDLPEGVEFEKVCLTFKKKTNYSTETSSKVFFYITNSEEVPPAVMADLDSNENIDLSTNVIESFPFQPTVKP